MIARLLGLPTISPRELHRRMQDGAVAVFDVNAPGVWLEHRVPGARHLEPGAFAASELSADRDAALVFYCSGPLCRKAPLAAKRARGWGYRNVFVMSAGISGWLNAGLPIERGGGGEHPA